VIVAGATRPGGQPPGQDRWYGDGSTALVLDGASSFRPSTADATEYVNILAGTLGELAPSAPDADLRVVLAHAIDKTATQLHLRPSDSPTSTVTIARATGKHIDVLALGDSTAIILTRSGELHRLTDGRLAAIGRDLHARYRRRLRSGSGYDTVHHELLGQLQREQQRLRNTPGGYWIAGADPHAAQQAIVHQYLTAQVEACVLATDGAQRVIDFLRIDWRIVATLPADGLVDLLEQLQDWETNDDPEGRKLPRAKAHDDKAIVVCRPDDVLMR
jgi:hypothetical protein